MASRRQQISLSRCQTIVVATSKKRHSTFSYCRRVVLVSGENTTKPSRNVELIRCFCLPSSASGSHPVGRILFRFILTVDKFSSNGFLLRVSKQHEMEVSLISPFIPHRMTDKRSPLTDGRN